MAENVENRKSLVEQIIDETLDRVAALEDIDPLVVQKLRDLAQAGEFSKANRVAQALGFEIRRRQ